MIILKCHISIGVGTVCIILQFFALGYRMEEDGKVNFKVLKVGILKISLMN